MNDAHFFLVAETHMQNQMKYLIKSLEIFSKLDNFYVTIMIPEGQKLKDKYLNKNCEVVHYKNKFNLIPKWSGAIRYFLESKSDVCLMLDCDILIVDSICDIVQKIKNNKKIYGAFAYTNPFDKNYWTSLFKQYKINYSEDVFKMHLENNNCSPSCYFNYGFVGLHKELMPYLAPKLEKFVLEINKKPINYKGQVALCLAIMDSNIFYENLDYKYNFSTHLSKLMLERININYDDLIEDLRVFHYCKNKQIIINKKSSIEKVQKCLIDCDSLNKFKKFI